MSDRGTHYHPTFSQQHSMTCLKSPTFEEKELIITSVQDMEEQLRSLNVESNWVGLQMHMGNKIMTNFETAEEIRIYHHPLEKVNSYKYLGQTLKMEDNAREEVLTRIKGGWRCLNKYRELLTNMKIPLAMRRRIFDQCILD